MPRVGAIQAAMVIMSCLRMILAGKPKLFNWDTDVDVANVKNAKCPESSVWMAWTNTLDSQALWNKDWAFARDANLDHVKFDSETGVLMQINKEAAKDLVMFSQSEWYPPLTLEVNVKSTGAPGVPSTLNLRNDTNTGQEIDFIIASREIEKDKLKHFLSVPVYRSGLSSSDNSAKLLVFDPNEDRDEIKVDLAEGVYFESNSSGRLRTFEDMTAEKRKQMFQENWAITWDGFEPDEELNTYFLQWNEDSIAWYGGPFQRPVERIKFSRVELRKEAFPTGPLPFRFGPYAIGEDDDWAGELDWEKRPKPVMQVQKIRVVGCRKVGPLCRDHRQCDGLDTRALAKKHRKRRR